MDKEKKTIKTYFTEGKENTERPLSSDKLNLNKGMNQFAWNLFYPEPERVEGMILWTGTPSAIIAPPGTYYYKLKIGKDSAEGDFAVLADPNYKISQQDYEAQFDFLQTVTNKFNEVQKTIKTIRTLRSQINDFVSRQGKDIPKDVKQLADSINKKMTSIEETLYQTKSKSSQDPLNYPIRLNDKLSGVYSAANSGISAPSKQVRAVYAELAAQCDEQIAAMKKIQEVDLVRLNQLIREKGLLIIGVGGK
jgi:hypothetical protein